MFLLLLDVEKEKMLAFDLAYPDGDIIWGKKMVLVQEMMVGEAVGDLNDL